MENQAAIYKDIALRTDGDIYIGVVGPVRTGKSTFIKRFMDLFVVPNIDNEHKRERTVDELPQSGAGRTIMTTQPKFVPNEAVTMTLKNGAQFNMRLVDCVGYLIDGVIGHRENDAPRMVRTPWAEEDMPFEEAAEIGTRKVISQHSTIGILVTTDGTVTDIPHVNYAPAEERVVRELKEINKPFVVVLNSVDPDGEEALTLASALEEKYDVTVIPVNVAKMTDEDVNVILERILLEFPINELRFTMPKWIRALSVEHPLVCTAVQCVSAAAEEMLRMRDSERMLAAFTQCDNPDITGINIESIELSTGIVTYAIEISPSAFYSILSRECGVEISDELALMTMMKELTASKKEYDRISRALNDVRTDGYGLVAPSMEELTLAEPEIVRQGGRYGVRLRASAPSLHLIRVDINTEICPIVGSEKQSEEMLNYLLGEFEHDPASIWESNIFGKSLNELVKESLSSKLMHMPPDVRNKVSSTLSRIINDGSGNLICIVL